MAKSPIPAQNQLRALRLRGVILTQEQVAKLLSLDNTTVSRHESGQIRLNKDSVMLYSELYGVPTHELFFGPYHEPVCKRCGKSQ